MAEEQPQINPESLNAIRAVANPQTLGKALVNTRQQADQNENAQAKADETTEMARRLISGGGGGVQKSSNSLFGPDPQALQQIQSQLQNIQGQRADLTQQLTPKTAEKDFLNVFLESLAPVLAAGALGGSKGLGAAAAPFARQQAGLQREKEVNQQQQREFATNQLDVLGDQEAALRKQVAELSKAPTNRINALGRMLQNKRITPEAYASAILKGGGATVNINNAPLRERLTPFEMEGIQDAFRSAGSKVPSKEELGQMTEKRADAALGRAQKSKSSDKAQKDLGAATNSLGQLRWMRDTFDVISKPEEEDQSATAETFQGLKRLAMANAPGFIPGRAFTDEEIQGANKADLIRIFDKNVKQAALGMASGVLAGVVTEQDAKAFANLFPTAGSSRDVGMSLLEKLVETQEQAYQIILATNGHREALTEEEFNEWASSVNSLMPGSQAVSRARTKLISMGQLIEAPVQSGNGNISSSLADAVTTAGGDF